MKKSLCFYLAAAMGLSLFAIEVDRNEIDSTKDRNIEFINYTGTHNTVDSVQSIRAIGSALKAAARTGQAGNLNKYAVIHCVDPTVKDGLDADIFIIGADANVDHINNIRLMISGYLSAAYGYSAKDAATIAHFVTVYNAVYRGRTAYFNGKYKAVVIKNLTAEKIGLSLRYDEWAGRTQIVIPLSDPKYAGTISTVDTSSISDKNVINKMREDDDKDIKNRKNLVDLKERESAAADKRAEAKQKEADKKQAEADKKQAEADKKQAEAEAAKEKASQTGSRKDIENAEKKEAEARKAQEDAEKIAEKARQEDGEAQAEREFSKTKTNEAQSDRKDIAGDTQRIIEDQRAEKKAKDDETVASAIPGYGLKVIDTADFLSELVLLDLKTEKELRKSAVDSIRGRTIYTVGKNLLAIAGSNSGNAVTALVLIDSRTLEIVKQSKENIADESLLVKNGNDYYAVIESGGKHYLGRFNENLELQARSSIYVVPYTPITISEKGLLVQDNGGAIRFLRLNDLNNIVDAK